MIGTLPADDLYYTLYNETMGVTVTAGTLWAANTSSNGSKWVDVPLSGTVTLINGDTYRIFLTSPGCYHFGRHR